MRSWSTVQIFPRVQFDHRAKFGYYFSYYVGGPDYSGGTMGPPSPWEDSVTDAL